jgi:hypothetical protein
VEGVAPQNQRVDVEREEVTEARPLQDDQIMPGGLRDACPPSGTPTIPETAPF